VARLDSEVADINCKVIHSLCKIKEDFYKSALAMTTIL
jgi:hypothetical protein